MSKATIATDSNVNSGANKPSKPKVRIMEYIGGKKAIIKPFKVLWKRTITTAVRREAMGKTMARYLKLSFFISLSIGKDPTRYIFVVTLFIALLALDRMSSPSYPLLSVKTMAAEVKSSVTRLFLPSPIWATYFFIKYSLSGNSYLPFPMGGGKLFSSFIRETMLFEDITPSNLPSSCL